MHKEYYPRVLEQRENFAESCLNIYTWHDSFPNSKYWTLETQFSTGHDFIFTWQYLEIFLVGTNREEGTTGIQWAKLPLNILQSTEKPHTPELSIPKFQ